MLRRDRQIRAQVQQLADACLFAASLWLSYEIRSTEWVDRLLNQTVTIDAMMQIGWLFFALILAGPLILETQGLYNRPVIGSRRQLFWALAKGCFFTTMAMVLVTFAVRVAPARGVMILFGVISFSLIWTKEEVLRLILHSKFARAQFRRNFLLIGSPGENSRLQREINEQHSGNIAIVAEMNLRDITVNDLTIALHDHSANGVIIGAKHANFERVESVIKVCELEGVETWLVADFFGTQIARADLDDLAGHPLLIFRTAPATSWQMLLKQFIDFTGAAALLILFTFVIPILPVIAIMVRFTSPGPVLFRQQRSGLNGSPFTLFKFRTMVTNAEQLKHELAAMNEMSGPVFKVTNDPRITWFGRLLRKYSLDELPQLYNVLRGEMSLVGPRPLPVDEVKRFNDLAHRRRLSVKPGLTCLWQVKGRNQISDFKDWVRLDLEYIDNWSFWLDIKILLLTVPVVFRGTGAK